MMSSIMEIGALILLSLALSTALGVFLRRARGRRLPPGPPAVPIIGNLQWLRRALRQLDLAVVLRDLHAMYGPIVTLYIGSRPTIFIADRSIAHQALVEHGTAFSDRPAPLVNRLFRSSQLRISSASYGPLWRLLRRNLTSEILHPSRIKLFAGGRAWVLGVLSQHLRAQADAHDGVVVVVESFRFAMFCLLVFMCFGEKLSEKAVRDIQDVQRSLLLISQKLNVLDIAPSISKYIFRNRLRSAMQIREKQRELYLPLIEARREYKKQQRHEREMASNEDVRFMHSYVDSLINIELPEEGGRKLSDDEIVCLCSEFLNGGTDTTSTALQWIMANLVMHQDIQGRLWEKIVLAATGSDGEEREIEEEDLQKMPYLKAVVMEGLRRHPPTHFLVPHAVTKDVSLSGYLLRKSSSINFFVAEMNWDGKVWEDPMDFKPERFMSSGGGGGPAVDITGSREIKMVTFGAGRRICPGMGLAMFHLEYFVMNLVREFEWKAVEGEEVDLTEEEEFTIVMKNPLRALIVPRKKTN